MSDSIREEGFILAQGTKVYTTRFFAEQEDAEKEAEKLNTTISSVFVIRAIRFSQPKK